VTIEELTSRLTRVLRTRPEVRLAFLFGSSVSRGVDAARDIDIAVAFTRSLTLLEQGAMASQLEQVTDREVDLIDLDQASTLLRWEVVRCGIPLFAREHGDLVEFRARVPLEYFDLQPFLEREAAGLRRALKESGWSSSKS
jgi:predicted nucleotidyltransferase